MKISTSIILFLVLGLSACSSSEQSTSNVKPGNDFYIFDDVKKVDSLSVDSDSIKSVAMVPSSENKNNLVVEKKIIQKFIVQIGAFTSKERAERFLIENQSKVDFKLEIKFNKQTNLFVVQFPPFSNRESAEKIRNDLWQIQAFKDAFIITSEE